MAHVSDILSHKGSRVYVIPPTATVLAATKMMNHYKIAAWLVVTLPDENIGERESLDRVIGMFTERDVLSRVVAAKRDPASTLVEEVMTTELAYCRPETDLDEISAVMRERHIRHMPVCDTNGDLAGLISIGDLNAWHARGQEVAIHFLHEYIYASGQTARSISTAFIHAAKTCAILITRISRRLLFLGDFSLLEPAGGVLFGRARRRILWDRR